MRYRARVAYEGTAYHGFQAQANATPTVQGVLDAALEDLSGVPGIRVKAAGRTDAGVHATGQVIAFDLEWAHGPRPLLNALNARLPDDVAIQELEEAVADFHPRYDAIARRYCYRFAAGPVNDPLRRRRVWWLYREPDWSLMQQASRDLPGTHDFRSFGTPPVGDSTIRTVRMVDWRTNRDEHEFIIEANAFLYRMVRRIVGTLVDIGVGRLPPDSVKNLIAQPDPTGIGATAPAHGLTLVKVLYGE